MDELIFVDFSLSPYNLATYHTSYPGIIFVYTDMNSNSTNDYETLVTRRLTQEIDCIDSTFDLSSNQSPLGILQAYTLVMFVLSF